MVQYHHNFRNFSKQNQSAEKGMREMAKVYKDKGDRLYLTANEVEEPAE